MTDGSWQGQLRAELVAAARRLAHGDRRAPGPGGDVPSAVDAGSGPGVEAPDEAPRPTREA